MRLSDSQRLKFPPSGGRSRRLLESRDRLSELRGQRKPTVADYASTSGIILRLEDDVWVNVPPRSTTKILFWSLRTYWIDCQMDSLSVAVDWRVRVRLVATALPRSKSLGRPSS